MWGVWYCCKVCIYKILYNRSDLHPCLQHLAVIILKLLRFFNVMKLLRFGLLKANSYAVEFAVRSKSTLQYVRMSFLPRKCFKLVVLASEWLGVFSKIYPDRAVYRFCRNHRQHFFDPTVLSTITTYWKQRWIDVRENSKSFWGEEDEFPTLSPGQTLMRTEMYFFNGLQIQLHKNWTKILFFCLLWTGSIF